jgi:dTDP-4-dehydrorhamnose 3,5-epimerase
MMQVKQTKIDGCKLIIPQVFYDFRGEYVESWHQNFYDALFPPDSKLKFVQDDFSISRRDVLRGMHGDAGTWKLVQCPMGELLIGVLDTRKDSPSYGNWELFPLNEKNRWQLLIPAGVSNGHLCLSEKCMFSYKQTSYYGEYEQFTHHFTSGGMLWPAPDRVVLSERDELARVWNKPNGE